MESVGGCSNSYDYDVQKECNIHAGGLAEDTNIGLVEYDSST